MKRLDETKVLRFASGEMDADEESNFLALCEIAADGWREAVLAVAEHRQLVETLGELATNSNRSDAGGRTKPGADARRSRLAIAAAALAMGLLLGVAGTRVAGLINGRDAQAVVAQSAVQQPELEVKRASDPASPILGDRLRTAAPIPEAQQVALESHDFTVKEEPTLYIVTTGDGTRWAIPIEQTTFCYAGH